MAEHESAHISEHCNHLTRRNALAGTTAVGALVLTAGAAVASRADGISPSADTDPRLAELEEGYRRWQDMLSTAKAIEDLEDEARCRAWARVTTPELPEPEPPTPEVAKLWRGPHGLLEEARDPNSYVTIPQDILDQYDAFRAEWNRWLDSKPRVAPGDPDMREALRLARRKKLLWKRADRLRLTLLKIPTTSPRGLLLKLALATDMPHLEDFDKRWRRRYYYGTFDSAADLLPPLLADLRAMVGTA